MEKSSNDSKSDQIDQLEIENMELLAKLQETESEVQKVR